MVNGMEDMQNHLRHFGGPSLDEGDKIILVDIHIRGCGLLLVT